MKHHFVQLSAISLALSALNVSAAVRYVNENSASPVSPYTNWATAAVTIQDAIDVATAGDEVVVTNGVYQTGGREVYGAMTNRVAVTQPVMVRSVNGPEVTVIRGSQVPGTTNGDGAVRCAYLTNGAALIGFTLTNGATRRAGDLLHERSAGGVWCESANSLVSNCTLVRNSAVRGGAAFSGTLITCTLTGNAAGSGGGAYNGTLQNCTLTSNSAGIGGGAYFGTLTNCTLTGNSAQISGGGAYSATLTNCTLSSNSATNGGGAYLGTLTDCTLTGNSARASGGGAYSNTLNNCTLADNSASASFSAGGGAFGSTLQNCTLTGNSASAYSGRGGGAVGSTLNSCTLASNFAAGSGGGAASSTLNNCTLTGNSARTEGGGAYSSTLNNCIVYYNTTVLGSGSNYSVGTLNYSCTTPLATNGVGNITAEPQLASASHLTTGSPCRGAGSGAYSGGVDIDGEPWSNPPDIGCDEFLGNLTGPLSVAIQAAYTNVAVGFDVTFTTVILGRTSGSWWTFGDGTIITNWPYRPFATHHWLTPGAYTVVLTAINDSYPAGVSTTVTVQVVEQPVHFVSLNSSSPATPYGSWATAASDIQAAVDAATVPGALVLVTNGVYNSGGRAVSGTSTNRVAVTKPLTVRSVNGPEVTVIRGYQVPGTRIGVSAVRCVYVTNNAALVGFTLTNGATGFPCCAPDVPEGSGGGVRCESSSAAVSNCTIIGNYAYDGGAGAYSGTLYNCTIIGNSAPYDGYGGGASFGTLNNCTLSDNWASDSGGAAFFSTLNNCTLTGNSASDGGGAFDCTLNNCIVYYNTAPYGANYSYSALRFCCTTPQFDPSHGNFTNAPLLVNQAGGNLRLASNSPCINAGNNTYAPTGLDLDGHQRIVGGTVDIGAYEFQSPQSLISYAWLQQYGLPTDGSADYTDLDGDGLNNWQEWQAGTDPTNALSVLRLVAVMPDGSGGCFIRFNGVTGFTYQLQRATNVIGPWIDTASITALAPGLLELHDSNAPPGSAFYRTVTAP